MSAGVLIAVFLFLCSFILPAGLYGYSWYKKKQASNIKEASLAAAKLKIEKVAKEKDSSKYYYGGPKNKNKKREKSSDSGAVVNAKTK
jgi:predicted negative regulator of RcsB-dependent stress response